MAGTSTLLIGLADFVIMTKESYAFVSGPTMVAEFTGVAISHAGLKALGVPEASLKSFPLPFQQGMAARAEQLRDFGENAPDRWEDAFRPGTCHIALTIYARDEDALEKAIKVAMTELEASHGVTLVGTHSFGADADAKNPFWMKLGFNPSKQLQSSIDEFLKVVKGR